MEIALCRVATADPTSQLRHTIKLSLCEALNKRKVERTIEIMSATYADTDVIFLQEAAAVFIEQMGATALAERYHIFSPAKVGGGGWCSGWGSGRGGVMLACEEHSQTRAGPTGPAAGQGPRFFARAVPPLLSQEEAQAASPSTPD